jgi:hypothetical protein
MVVLSDTDLPVKVFKCREVWEAWLEKHFNWQRATG